VTEKKITIGINVKGRNFNHKAKHGMTAFKSELTKHFRNKVCVVSPAINELIFEKGRFNCPSKVTFVCVEKNNKVYLFLETQEDQKRKEELISGKKIDNQRKDADAKPELKKETKKETVKSESKKEEVKTEIKSKSHNSSLTQKKHETK